MGTPAGAVEMAREGVLGKLDIANILSDNPTICQ
jgi:hypothetical protein